LRVSDFDSHLVEQDNSDMTNKWYAIRKGNEFLIKHTNAVGALLLHNEGWEVGAPPFDSREKAEEYLKGWIERYNLISQI
jgi:hypothetical protein